MDFSGMTDKNKQMIYSKMWGDNFMVTNASVMSTPYRGTVSKNSFRFDIKGKSKMDSLKEIFEITDEKSISLFDEKFKQACDGSGNEETRITTLHSSSMCALMFFYKVSKENPIHIWIDDEEAVFTESIFEYQNKVTNTGGPSNIDVTLLGTIKNKRVLMFLESKFAEYVLYAKKTIKIKNEYLNNKYSSPIYKDKFWEKSGLKINIEKGKNEFIVSSNRKVYLEGLKQMVSHYVGVRKFINGVINGRCDDLYNSCEPNKTKIQEQVRKYVDQDTKIYLGTILFNNRIGMTSMNDIEESYFENYNKLYGDLGKCLNDQLVKDNITQMKVLSKVITYEDTFFDQKDKAGNFYSDQKVRSFYFKE